MSLTIVPPNRFVLSWKMFKDAPKDDPHLTDDQGNTMDARTSCKFIITPVNHGVKVEVKKAFFKIRTGTKRTSNLLKHEQGHADLAWLAALAAGQEYLETKDYPAIISSKHTDKLNEADSCYDARTEHGVNLSSQAHWNHLIDSAILHKKTQVDIYTL